jgi:hypothetical protein
VGSVDASAVESRADLVRFLAELSAGVRAGGTNVENESAAALLEAASAWVDDYDGYFVNRGEPIPESPDWKLIATIFAASLVYE